MKQGSAAGSKFCTGAAAGGDAGRNQHFHRAPDVECKRSQERQREVFRNRRFLNGALPTLSLYYRGPRASPAKRVAWGKDEQRNERAFAARWKRTIWSL